MFSLLRTRRQLREARTKIGIDLHRQIRAAVLRDEAGTAVRLSSAFTPGYIYAFVRDSFASLDVDAGSKLDLHIHFVCDGVIPGKLYKIYRDQGAALALAKQMKDQTGEILNTGLSPQQVIKSFALGARSGSFDAPLVSFEATPPDNLRRFLLNEPLNS